MDNEKGKRVTQTELAKRTRESLEEELNYFLENVPPLLNELKRLQSAESLWDNNNHLAYEQGRSDAIDDFISSLDKLSDINIDKIKELAKKCK